MALPQMELSLRGSAVKFINFVKYQGLGDCELLEWLIEGVNPDLLTIDLSPGKE